MSRLIVLAVAALGAATLSRRCVAQGPARFAIEGTVGVSTGRGGEFFDRNQQAGRIALSARAWRSTMHAFEAEVAKDVFGVSMGHYSICYPTSTGGCERPFPELAGYSALLGMVALPFSHLEVGVDVGGATVASGATRTGAFVSQASMAPVLGQHAALVLLVRRIIVPDFDGQRLTMTPVQVGLRVR